MKFVIVAFVAVVLLSAIVTVEGVNTGKETSLDVKALEDSVLKAFEAYNSKRRDAGFGTTGPAINWTWASWSSGPTCEDYGKYTLVNLSSSTKAKIAQESSSLLNLLLKQLQAQTFDGALGFGITYNGETLFMDAVGVKAIGTTDKATVDTVFSIGSVTKIFTSLMMNALVEQDVLRVTDPVTKFFSKDTPPEFNPVNPYDSEKGASAVTLESLSSQTSGLGRECACPIGMECEEDTIITQTNIVPLFHQPLTKPHYSNYGFALLGHACERAASVKYEQWVKDNILTKFGMSSSGFDYPDDIKKRMATGYTVANQAFVVDPLFAHPLYWSNPCGGLYSSLRDMMSFVTHLTTKEGLLSKNGYEQYFFDGSLMPDGVSSYGKSGWETVYANGFRTLTKGGLIGGFGTTLAFVPELNLGMFFWMNMESGILPSKFTAEMMNQIVPWIKDELVQHAPKQDFPSFADEIVGKYVDGNNTVLMTIRSNKKTKTTGIFPGDLTGVPVTFQYDSKTTNAVNKNGLVFFRYHLVQQEGFDACFVETSTGTDDGLIAFYQSESNKEWLADIPDFGLVGLVRTDLPPISSSSSSSSPSSSPSQHSSGASTFSFHFILLSVINVLFMMIVA